MLAPHSRCPRVSQIHQGELPHDPSDSSVHTKQHSEVTLVFESNFLFKIFCVSVLSGYILSY